MHSKFVEVENFVNGPMHFWLSLYQLERPFTKTSQKDNVYILVDDSLLGTANNRLLLLLLGNLGGLRLDLTGTSEGTVNFTLNFRVMV